MMTAHLIMQLEWGVLGPDRDVFPEDTYIINIETEELTPLIDIETPFIPNDMVYYLSFVPSSRLLKELIKESGPDEIYGMSIPYILSFIKSVKKGPSTLGEFIKWVEPKHGEITIIYDIKSWQSNHPEDPEEWDSIVQCHGILGFDVKIVKNEH